MERYNYLEKMTFDIIEYIKDNYTNEEIIEKLESRDEWAQNGVTLLLDVIYFIEQ